MNTYDRQNLEFIMQLDKEQVRDWYDEMDDEDKAYAHRLLDQFGKELHFKEVMIKNFRIKDLSQAKQIINRIRYSV